MRVLMSGNWDSYAQFLTVLVVFVLVLALTALVTRWIARYQKQQYVNCNVEVVETGRIADNKYVQIVRVGETYIAIAVSRDSVTMLCEVPKEELRECRAGGQAAGFRELLDKALKKDTGKSDEPKE